jgi:hypothetical protein
VLALVRRARRRVLHNELFSQGANAFCAALVAFILLLLFGTRALDWRWTLLIPIGAAAAGIYVAWKRLPSLYNVAQLVDHRMSLADSLSTALYFGQEERRAHVSAEVRELQFKEAERLSEGVDARKAIPYALPRAMYAAGALLLVASSLFALRYGLSRRLDLKPPLASILQQTLGGPERTEVAKNDPRRTPAADPDAQDDNGESVAPQDQQMGGANEGEPSAGDQEQADAKMEKSGGKKSGDSKAEDGAEKSGDEQESEGQEGNSAAKNDNGQNGKSGDQKQQSGANQQSPDSGESSSLLSKVKDAWQNLMSRMKQQPGTPGSQQSPQDQNSKQAKGQQNGGKQQSKEGQQQSGNQQGDQEGQAGEQAQNAQDPQGKGQGKSDAQQASKQPGSGIGSQDGSKDIKQAEQLAAMGKISEIIGKRSATVTGEATVEVQSTSQTLHTPYAQRGAQHTQGGAEISRDEIPVALQPYVEQYFEQVRKVKK